MTGKEIRERAMACRVRESGGIVKAKIDSAMFITSEDRSQAALANAKN